MTINEGAADRVIRLVVAAAAVLVSWWAGFGSAGGIILLVVAGIAFVTATVGYCPTYQLFKFSTRPSAAPDHHAQARDASLAFRDFRHRSAR